MNQDDIESLMDITGLSRREAEELLNQNDGDVNQASNQFFQPKSKSSERAKSTSSSAPSSSRVATLQNTSTESDDQDEDEEGEEYFAGGKASGVAIKGPTKTQEVVGGILKKAEETGRKELEEKKKEEKKKSFKGKAYKLGSSETNQSEEIDIEEEDHDEPTQISLTFWQDGFSIDDGPLRQYDDPANNLFLSEIKNNKIPSEIAHNYGHNLKILVSRKLEDKYVPPKKVIKPFSGAGNRLGSYVPGEPAAVDQPAAPIASTPIPSTSSSASTSVTPSAQPVSDKSTTSIQIRLADGTRMVLKIALDEPVSEIRKFIRLSRSQDASKNFVLMTTFPNKEITDENQSIQQANLANSVIVQRYK